MQIFVICHDSAASDTASDSVHPLTSCGCGESRLMTNRLKGREVDIECVLVSPFPQAEQTPDVVRECMDLPADIDVLPELTPCGDVSLISAYLQALANGDIATALVISYLPLVGYLASKFCPGETSPVFTISAIISVTSNESGKDTFNWQVSPCSLKMTKMIQAGRIRRSHHPEGQRAISAALFIFLHHGSSDGSHSSTLVGTSSVVSLPYSFGV